jgi:C-terminal processing protease CtpA/Prc
MNIKLMAVVVIGSLSLASRAWAQEHVGGIGIDLGVRHPPKMEVIHVFTNTPASKAGIVPGVFVQKIDGTATEGKTLADCAKMIQGPVGTRVALELVDTEAGKTNTVVMIRAEIKR